MDRKQVAKELRAEADKLMQAAAMLEGSGGISSGKSRKPMSEETKAKMKAAQQARWAKTKKPAKKSKQAEAQ